MARIAAGTTNHFTQTPNARGTTKNDGTKESKSEAKANHRPSEISLFPGCESMALNENIRTAKLNDGGPRSQPACRRP